MKLILTYLCFFIILHGSYAPPVSPDKSHEQDSEVKDDLDDYMEYHRYLKEVVQALESDPDFRERLEKADEDDVRSGKIAEQLDFVNHNVRTKLDEIKRRELERLRHLATRQYELTNDLEMDSKKVPSNEHLDHVNPHTFEIEDLKKLIKKTTADLEAADKRRKEEFKEYEMQKEFDKKQKMETLDETQKKEYMEQLKKEEEAKKHHKPIHHPGSKQQLEEVWEKQDHMDQQFDPKTFFMMHDVDGNGVWDADEVKALFIKELDKVYNTASPNTDLHERAEEMERMREHVFKENDKNHDGLIDYNEFLMETQRADFNKDEEWKPIEENQVYTQMEYDEYARRKHEELTYLQQRGLVDAHGRPLPGAQHQIYQALQQLHHYRQQQAYQGHQQFQGQQYYPPGQVPPQGHIPQGQVPQGQVPQYQQQQQQQQIPQHQGQQSPQYQGQQAPQYQGQQPPQYQGQQQPQYQGQQPPQYQSQQPAQYQGQQPPQYQGQQSPQFSAQQPPQVQAQQPPQGQQPPQVQAQQPPLGQQPPQMQAQQPPQGQQPPQVQAQQPPQVPAQVPQQPPANVNQAQPVQPVQVQSPQVSQGQAPGQHQKGQGQNQNQIPA